MMGVCLNPLSTFKFCKKILCVCVCVCVLPACVPGAHKRHKRVRVPGTGVLAGCEVSFGCWRWNPSPQQEQRMLFTAELSQ